MAVRQFTLPVEPNNEQVGQIAVIVDPGTGYSPTVDATGAIKVTGGGTSDTTAANQALQLAQETLAAVALAAIRTAVGADVSNGVPGKHTSVGAGSETVLAADANRMGVTFDNTSNAVFSLSVGSAAAVAGSGIVLASAVVGGVGGSRSIWGPAAALAIKGITTGAGKTLAYHTFTKP